MSARKWKPTRAEVVDVARTIACDAADFAAANGCELAWFMGPSGEKWFLFSNRYTDLLVPAPLHNGPKKYRTKVYHHVSAIAAGLTHNGGPPLTEPFDAEAFADDFMARWERWACQEAERPKTHAVTAAVRAKIEQAITGAIRPGYQPWRLPDENARAVDPSHWMATTDETDEIREKLAGYYRAKGEVGLYKCDGCSSWLLAWTEDQIEHRGECEDCYRFASEDGDVL